MPAEPKAATPTIAKFDKSLHDRSDLSCGFGPIDHFLKSSRSSQIKPGMIVAWMATADGDPAVPGFYTLGAMAVRAGLGFRGLAEPDNPRGVHLPMAHVRATLH